MKRKLLCMLLSAAMVFTTGDLSALTLVRAEEVQTTAEETEEAQEEASANAQGTAEKQETTQEAAEDAAFGEREEDSGTETSEQESQEEMQDGTTPETVSETDMPSTEEITEETTETEESQTEETSNSEETESSGETESSEEISGKNITETKKAAKLEVVYHTADEIREFLDQEAAVNTDGITYAAEPAFTAPYAAGALSASTLDAVKAYVRQIRFIAGVPYDVDFNDEYSRLSQAAAFVNCMNGELSHEPAQPQGMSEELYRLACDGASQTNLAYTDGEPSMQEMMNNSWMADNDVDNFAEISLRRQILNPSAELIGFGAVKGSNGIYSALYAADCPESDETVSGVVWPAQTMPTAYFDIECFWSVSTGEALNASDIYVTLTRKSDNAAWHFGADSAEGDFYVDDNGIFFRPNLSDMEMYADGDSYQVEITNNEEEYIHYQVNFFSLEQDEEEITEAAPLHYTAAFETNGGTPVASQSIQEGQTVKQPVAPVKGEYIFDGWYKEAACVNVWNFETDIVTQDTVLYAKWMQEDVANMSTSSLETAANTKIELTEENTKISSIKAKVYDGKQYLPTVKVTIEKDSKWVALTEGVDYSVSYRNNTNAGIGQVVIRGSGVYTGEVTKDFEITKKPMSKLKVVTDSLTVGSDPKRSLRLWVYDGNRRLGTNEYTLEYDAENLTIKETTSAKVIVNAAENSNYIGSATTKVTVCRLKETERLLGPSNVQFETRTAVYTGKAITTAVEPKVIYKISNKETITLEKNKDYKLQYQNNINVGTAHVIVTGKGQYKGKVVGEFTITASDAAFDIKDIPAKTYNGSLQKPKLSVKAGGKTLKLNQDYVVAYANNLNASTETRKASVTIAGIGNYAKSPRKTITFEIKPQKISKASLQGSLTTGISLIYNKRTLSEGKDYNKPVYDVAKGSKIAVTITGKGNFTGEMKKSANIDVSTSKMTPVISSNKNRQNYTSFEGIVMHSYLVKTKDAIMRVEHVSGKGVYAETYTSDFTLRSRKFIAMELPKFGGFYEGANYYFLVFGQENPNEDNETEVMRVVKYDKNWKRKGSASIYGANTYSPFKNGGLRMVEFGDMLYIRTCHQMYMTYDGNRHQASAAFSISIPKMEVLEQIAGISQTAYVSHSFNQFILTDGSDLLAVDHGDAYPRSVVLAKYVRKAGEEGVLNKGCNSVTALKIQGKHNAYTGVSVGGFEASDTAYLTTGNSVDQNPETYSSGGIRNIFVSSTQKDNFAQGGTTVHWITNYKDKSEASVTTPQLVKISGTEFMLMWGEGAQVKCVLLNAAGEPVTGIYAYDGMLSDCKPIVLDGNVVWYYTNNSEPIFSAVKIEDVRNQSK